MPAANQPGPLRVNPPTRDSRAACRVAARGSWTRTAATIKHALRASTVTRAARKDALGRTQGYQGLACWAQEMRLNHSRVSVQRLGRVSA